MRGKRMASAGLVAARGKDGVEGDLEHELRLDGAHRAELFGRVRAHEAVEADQLLVGEAGVGLTDRHELAQRLAVRRQRASRQTPNV